ncbi:MAG: beta-propeller domain-containing protein [bacterium]
MKTYPRKSLGILTNPLGKSALLVAALGLAACDEDADRRDAVDRLAGLPELRRPPRLLPGRPSPRSASGAGPSPPSAAAPSGPRTTPWGAPQEGTGGAPTFSDTNVQVAGVDEPDQVKTDGRYLVTRPSDPASTRPPI